MTTKEEQREIESDISHEGRTWEERYEAIGKVVNGKRVNKVYLIMALRTLYNKLQELIEWKEYYSWRDAETEAPERDYEEVDVYFEYFRYGSYNRMFRSYGTGYTVNGEFGRMINGESGWDRLKVLKWKYKERAEENV